MCKIAVSSADRAFILYNTYCIYSAHVKAEVYNQRKSKTQIKFEGLVLFNFPHSRGRRKASI